MAACPSRPPRPGGCDGGVAEGATEGAAGGVAAGVMFCTGVLRSYAYGLWQPEAQLPPVSVRLKLIGMFQLPYGVGVAHVQRLGTGVRFVACAAVAPAISLVHVHEVQVACAVPKTR
jgi:hypothetical protein